VNAGGRRGRGHGSPWASDNAALGFTARRVAANSDAGWLVQRSVAGYAGGYGHCTFMQQELTKAFLDLVVWGEYGVKPAF
jgi:hypothetical protein